MNSTSDSRHAVTDRSFSRRSLVKALAGFGATAAVLTPALALVSPATARSTDSLLVNTAGARLRSGPGTGYRVLASLAKGTEVRFLADGGSANGYRWSKVRVLATGQEGFVAASLLSAPDGGTSPDLVIIGSARTTSAVNLRSGPSTSNQVLRVVPSGATVQISSTVRSGFRYVTHNGLAGWIADQYLSTVPGDAPPADPVIIGSARTTDAVNLRSGSSTSNQVLRVVPSGATVQISSTVKNGFRYVIHNGLAGWIADQYLTSGGGQDGPVPAYQTTTADLNLRAEPNLSARVLLVIPSGSRVRPNGALAYDFAQVNYNGTVGWAHIDYLK